jgi:predicted ATPase
LVKNLRDNESVRLFEERAQLVQMDFSLTIEKASSVAKICNQLDGIPLAIELAAARVSAFSAEQIAAHLQESFRLLNIGNRSALPRHQTLQATIDWSYDLLSPAEKSVFLRLSISLMAGLMKQLSLSVRMRISRLKLYWISSSSSPISRWSSRRN